MKLFLTVALLLPLAGCGYHQVGSATHIPAGVRTLSVPIFQSRVQAYNTELRTIPGRWIAGFLYPDAKVKETFTISEKAQEAPKVQF